MSAIPSPRRFFNAFKRMQVTDLQKQMLEIHYLSPNRTISAPLMAKALGFSHHGPVNGTYGKLGRELGRQLRWAPSLYARHGVARLALLEKPYGVWRWVMRPEVSAALETLKWVTTSEVSPLPEEGPDSDLFRVEEHLMVKHPEGGERLIAELFPHRGGAVFFDCGWVFEKHPVHELPGPIIKEGKGCWRFGDLQRHGDITVHVVTRREFPLLAAQAELWDQFKTHEDGENATRERAYEIFLGSFGEGR